MTVNKPSEGRRGFLRFLGTGTAALVFLKSTLARAKKLAFPLSKAPALSKVGGSVKLKIKGHPVIFVRDTETSVRAFDPTCTHKKCSVKFSSDTSNFHCKCHKSAYNLDGKVLGGPAPKPLKRFPSKLDGDRILLALPDTPPPPDPDENDKE